MLRQPAHDFPFLALIVSGGHTMLVHATERFNHHVLGETRDDASGEAFDKVAKMLKLGYPGGPVIDALAKKGNREAIRFPRSFLGDESFDFSFSGIKTAVLYHVRDNGLPSTEQGMADLCASFQEAVVDVLSGKTIRAARQCRVEAYVSPAASRQTPPAFSARSRVQETQLPAFHPAP
jgi:N6-L-threonylcarbamoyladenine synthase